MHIINITLATNFSIYIIVKLHAITAAHKVSAVN